MTRSMTIRLLPFVRYISINRPSPLPLPPKEQREFEELLRKANEQESETHKDAPKELKAEFEGDVNPVTGEKGGPKIEPVKRCGEDPGGDWSFKGRVSDF
ncbi:hypothetical protein CVT24_009421 [Panaeolus cyanescens]|uniref:Succinate dehydrogenase assembly factor 4, mitochondrial n=1 Tax=Panaeolus cyanescens TaxID=181874 RepID=A0A409VAR0_9AGAR|nr:hypothetical protein CVT24_009421 [Panaeolus cyanescens]